MSLSMVWWGRGLWISSAGCGEERLRVCMGCAWEEAGPIPGTYRGGGGRAVLDSRRDGCPEEHKRLREGVFEGPGDLLVEIWDLKNQIRQEGRVSYEWESGRRGRRVWN